VLTLNMLKASEAEVCGIVAAQCSSFGTGTVLRVALPDDRTSQGAAIVRMSSDEEATRLVSGLGGSRCGNKVILKLLQEGAAVPSMLTTNHGFDPLTESLHEDEIAA
jgi:hypothetical protein